jgi:predicted O-linked N-acetylglucosamine transferase (SPINDLY family)
MKIYLKTCQWTKVNPLVEQMWSMFDHLRRKDKFKNVDIFSLFNLPLSIDQQHYLATWKADCVKEKTKNDGQSYAFSRHSKEKIRLGYVSSDFRDHPIGSQARKLLKFHDKGRFEIYCYSIGPNELCKIRMDIKQNSTCFRDLNDFEYTRIADIIHEDEIDILVDLNGYTAHAKPEIFALEAAPIQINYLGNPGTMGSKNYQYMITNRTATPSKQEAFITERCIFIPKCHQIADDIENWIHGSENPLRLTPVGQFVFCCFNRMEKINLDIFSVWMRILLRTPGSTLWLLRFHSTAETNLKTKAGELGVNPDRLKFFDVGPKGYLLKQQMDADLFLDTLHFNANVTAINALSIGLPILTMPGETFISRVCASLLIGVDMPELIASNIQDYENIAVDLANNPSKVLVLKERLIKEKSKLQLFNTASTVRYLEKAYEKVWINYLAGNPAQSFEIEE